MQMAETNRWRDLPDERGHFGPYGGIFVAETLIAALEELLEIIMRDKKWDDEAPRKTYVGLLELMTPPKPKADPAAAGKSAGGIELAGKAAVQEDPQAQMVSQYRRKLSMALN